jgi:putative salt-induced outer membrane protein YdiY
MTTKLLRAASLAATVCVTGASPVRAQQPPAAPAPMKALTGSAGAGLSLTQGNSETLNLSATVDAVYDPKTGNVMKWATLFLRGKQNGVVTVNRVSAGFRDENRLSPRTFVFGQVDTLHDTFKAIDYLIAPTAGFGYKAIDSMNSQLAVDVGAGGVVEKDSGAAAQGNGAITLGEKLVHQLTATTTLKQSAASLLKMNHVSDGLYTFQVGVAVKISEGLQLSVDVLDTYKNHPLDPATKRNDVAVVTSVIAKY